MLPEVLSHDFNRVTDVLEEERPDDIVLSWSAFEKPCSYSYPSEPFKLQACCVLHNGGLGVQQIIRCCSD